ncbi:MAG: hypothetical protein WBN04_16780 [Paracoccaceae bacterium]
MRKSTSLGWIVALCLTANAAVAAGTGFAAKPCAPDLARGIPARATAAPAGSAVMQQVLNLSGTERDRIVADQVLSGNVPGFLRSLIPVTFSGTTGGQQVQVTICVTPDYLAVGNDRDFVRAPMGLPAAARIAIRFGFLLPTPTMVDAIYAQARVHLAPSPMKPTNQMSSTRYLVTHNQTVDGQRAPLGRGLDELTAGQKKDLVLSTRLRSAPGRVAIYGWHRTNGKPIQPLSTVHGARYADYSHGVRLVSKTAFVNGRAAPLADIMQDPALARIVSSEGPIDNAQALLASIGG